MENNWVTNGHETECSRTKPLQTIIANKYSRLNFITSLKGADVLIGEDLFIKEFADITLYVLKRKNVVFISTDCQEAMDKLKSKLTSLPILYQPDFNIK